jgi:hypothetical protein
MSAPLRNEPTSNEAGADRLPHDPKTSGFGGPVANIAAPFTKAGAYYAKSWGNYLGGASGGLPVARPTLSLASHALRDEIVLMGLKWRRPVSDFKAYGRIDEEVAKALKFYDSQGWLEKPSEYFAAPSAPTDIKVREFASRNRSHQRLSFTSGYQPHPDEPARDRWLGYSANHREYAIVLRHQEPRPWMVCVHGTEMGRASLDLTLFRAWHLHENFGLNVVLPVLPMHGPRGKGLPKGAVYPGEDILDVVHATAQSVWDIRRLLAWIRSEDPDAKIGLNGISLGGYISGLVASLDEDLTCAILGVPPANLVELLARHAGLDKADPRRATLEQATPIGQMISPLFMEPKVAPKGRFIYAGVADRIVHPREQVLQLWEHWGRPDIGWYHGGHTGFFQARPVQRFIDAAIVHSGLAEQR